MTVRPMSLRGAQRRRNPVCHSTADRARVAVDPEFPTGHKRLPRQRTRAWPRSASSSPATSTSSIPQVGLATVTGAGAAGRRRRVLPEGRRAAASRWPTRAAPRTPRPLAERFLAIFGQYDHVVVPSGSCVSMVRNHYGQWLEGKPDVDAAAKPAPSSCASSWSTSPSWPRSTASFRRKVGLHQSCHGLRELRLGSGRPSGWCAPLQQGPDAARASSRASTWSSLAAPTSAAASAARSRSTRRPSPA